MPKITQPVSERPVPEPKLPGSKNRTHLTPFSSTCTPSPSLLWTSRCPAFTLDRDAAGYESWQACVDMMGFSSFTIFPRVQIPRAVGLEAVDFSAPICLSPGHLGRSGSPRRNGQQCGPRPRAGLSAHWPSVPASCAPDLQDLQLPTEPLKPLSVCEMISFHLINNY